MNIEEYLKHHSKNTDGSFLLIEVIREAIKYYKVFYKVISSSSQVLNVDRNGFCKMSSGYMKEINSRLEVYDFHIWKGSLGKCSVEEIYSPKDVSLEKRLESMGMALYPDGYELEIKNYYLDEKPCWKLNYISKKNKNMNLESNLDSLINAVSQLESMVERLIIDRQEDEDKKNQSYLYSQQLQNGLINMLDRYKAQMLVSYEDDKFSLKILSDYFPDLNVDLSSYLMTKDTIIQ